MSHTIYRKYRPQTFGEIMGQNHIKITLENEILTSRIAHAYLFAGPRGIGKTTTARIFAKAINCQKRKPSESEPCNKCDSCKDITGGRSLDLIEIDAASHTGVDNVRDNIIENARFTPSRWKYKVFIIDEVHMLSLSAFNALLKTLEEPPDYAVFILCTTEIHRLPETIISRCQRFDFKKINQADLLKRLKFVIDKEGVKVDESILQTIARRAEGSSRDAESLLGQILTLGGKKITAEMADLVLPRSNLEAAAKLFDYLASRKTSGALELVNNLAQEGVNFVQFSKELVEFLRKILLIKVNGRLDIFSSLELTQEMEKSTIDQAKEIELERLVKAINLFLEKERDIKYSDIPQLPLELAIVEICETEPSARPPEPPVAPTGSSSAAKEPPKTAPLKKNNSLKITLEDIRGQWSEVKKRFSEANPSLALVFKLSEPCELSGHTLTLRCPYAIHINRLKQQTTRKNIEQVLSEVFGEEIKIEAVIGDIAAGDSSEDDSSELNPILETFGGKVVG
ncbi:MAG: DNA polymerase III subunit gamma/tau [Patescibacteria group bacterium]|nr:DNA polymerase III subunit gamma/tau [Patescibacteria group bacterium]